MARTGMEYKLSFDGKTTWQDITQFVDSRQTSVKRLYQGPEDLPTISTMDITLRHKERQDAAHAVLVGLILQAQQNKTRVDFVANKDGQPYFTGHLNLSDFSQTISKVPMWLNLNVYDEVESLDRYMTDGFEYPPEPISRTGSGTTEDPYRYTLNQGYCVYKNSSSDYSDDIVVQVLLQMGYSLSDINMSASEPIFASDGTTLRICTYAAYDPDDKRKCREYLGKLLRENNACLSAGKDGRFIIRSTKQTAATLANPTILNRFKCDNQNGITIQGSMWAKDGVEVQWSTAAIMRALVYNANFSWSVEEGDSGNTIIGEELEPHTFWPETGNEEEVWQEFTADWLDRKYYTKQSKLKDTDLSLLTVKNVDISAQKDSAIILGEFPDGTVNPTIKPLKVRALYYNSSLDVKTFESFKVYGDCLYRSQISHYMVPSGAKEAEAYESEFIFTEEQANEFSNAFFAFRHFGDIRYSWKQYEDVSVGAIYQVSPPDTQISTLVMINQIVETMSEGRIVYECTGIGVAEYNALALRKRTIINGAVTNHKGDTGPQGPQGETGAQGPQGAAGEDGNSPIIQYALGTSLTDYPLDHWYYWGEAQIMWGDREVGDVGDWALSPPAVPEGKYLWMRVSLDGGETWTYSRLTGAAYVWDFSLSKQTYIRNNRLTTDNVITLTPDIQGYDINTFTWSVDHGTLSTSSGIPGTPVTLTIPYSNSYDSVTITMSDGTLSVSKVISVVDMTTGAAYLGAVDELPGSAVGLGTLLTGDYCLLNDATHNNVPYQWDGDSWEIIDSNSHESAIIATILDDAVRSNTTVDSVSALWAFFKRLGANSAFIKFLTVYSLFIGSGTPTSGFYVKISDHDTTTGELLAVPVFTVLYNGENFFTIDFADKTVTLGDYAGDGGIKWDAMERLLSVKGAGIFSGQLDTITLRTILGGDTRFPIGDIATTTALIQGLLDKDIVTDTETKADGIVNGNTITKVEYTFIQTGYKRITKSAQVLWETRYKYFSGTVCNVIVTVYYGNSSYSYVLRKIKVDGSTSSYPAYPAVPSTISELLTWADYYCYDPDQGYVPGTPAESEFDDIGVARAFPHSITGFGVYDSTQERLFIDNLPSAPPEESNRVWRDDNGFLRIT